MLRSSSASKRQKQALLPLLLLVAFTLAVGQGCGYHHPGAARTDGKKLRIAVTNWRNQTGELGLESDLLQPLIAWFSKGNVIALSNDDEEAQYFLHGTLISLRSPGQSYTATDRATQLQARLRVSYQVKDRQGNIVLEKKEALHTETYTVETDAIRTRDNLRKALRKLFDDIAEDIYLQLLVLYDEGEKI